MSNVIITPNMLLREPIVGVEIGPQWATDLNNCLNIIDIHDHSPGYGVQITPAGMDINTSLSFQGNAAVSLLSTNFISQASNIVANAALNVVGGNLWYNNGA